MKRGPCKTVEKERTLATFAFVLVNVLPFFFLTISASVDQRLLRSNKDIYEFIGKLSRGLGQASTVD